MREHKWNGALAQLGERYNGIVEVSGSIPLSSTNLLHISKKDLANQKVASKLKQAAGCVGPLPLFVPFPLHLKFA